MRDRIASVDYEEKEVKRYITLLANAANWHQRNTRLDTIG